MQSAFERAVAVVLEREGVLSEDPADDGGLTKFGISSRAYPALDIRALTREQAVAIYRRDFWLRCGCAELPWRFALAVFDGAVNQGQRTAVKLFQRSIGVRDDGVFGPITLRAALWAHHHERTGPILADYFSRRIKRYAEHPDWPVFGRGWARRCFLVQQDCLQPRKETFHVHERR